ncbi:putative membrane protein [Propionispora sp. 2/2-37]|uniref:PTS sugar transporter subunit IIC n=1 Tax=Propionispora sp. 2/2-37 TaxID=1677858 RepID=UPI0006C6779D|nr:PTS transporter subunit EIIC [Propionispora sp. 2/2-37]CUH95289.1 putative membrane protein [Propionispora sp. 2/2-37]
MSMQTLTTKLEAVMLPISAKIASNRYLLAMRDAFSIILSFVLVGSFFGILNWVILDPFGTVMGPNGLNLGRLLTGLTGEAYKNSGFVAAISDVQYVGNLVVGASFGIFSLLLTISFGYRLGDIWNADKLIAAILSVVATFVLIPQSFKQLISMAGTDTIMVNGAVKVGYFGTGSVMTTLLVATATVWLFAKLSNNKSMIIKMPESVPESVTRSFQALIPITITLFFIALFAAVLHWLEQPSFHDLIYTIVQAPLLGFSQGIGFALLYQFITWFFWWFGIHGHNVTAVIQNSVYLPAQLANQEGSALYIFSNGFFEAGLMHIMGLVLAILIFSRREDWRAVVKVGLPSMLFNIQEPLAFGLPIVLNPIFFIPYVIAPLINTFIGWLAITVGLVPVFKYVVPWTMPLFFGGMIGTGTLGGGLLQVVFLLVDTLLYAPFVIVGNKIKDRIN